MEPFIRYMLMGTGFLILFFIFLNSVRHRKEKNKRSHHSSAPEFSKVFFEEEEPEEEAVKEVDAEDEAIEDAEDETIENEWEEEFEEIGEQETLPKNTVKTEEREPNKKLQDEFIQIPIIAESGKFFGGYDLLQTLTSNHFYFGDMNIFHYHQDMNPSSKKLFSLASLQKPGDFDLDRIGLFKTKGLVLFMNRADHPEYANHVYELMVEIAYQLSEDLGGVVKI